MKSAILPQILKLEDSFREYEKIASTLAEEIRFCCTYEVLRGSVEDLFAGFPSRQYNV